MATTDTAQPSHSGSKARDDRTKPAPSSSDYPKMLGGRYQLHEKIGRGGVGIVFKCTDRRTGATRAAKILTDDHGFNTRRLRRFEHECRVLTHFEHPNIVGIYDFGVADIRPWLIMELCTDRNGDPFSLRHLQDAAPERRLSVTQLEQVIPPLLAALAELHNNGLVHRDVKPENILLVEDHHGKLEPKLTDFGLVALTGDDEFRERAQLSVSLTTQRRGQKERALMGTYAYMSPEQKTGDVLDARSDVYSFGLMLYRLTTGYERVSFELPCAVRSELPDWVDRLVTESVDEEPDNRARSAEALYALLPEHLRDTDRKRVQLPTPATTADPGPAKPTPITGRKHVALMAAIAITTAVLWMLANRESTVEQTPGIAPVPQSTWTENLEALRTGTVSEQKIALQNLETDFPEKAANAIPELVAAMFHSDPEIREMAVTLVSRGNVPLDALTSAVVQRFSDAKNTLELTHFDSASEPTPRFTPALLAVLSDTTAGKDVHTAAAAALEKIGVEDTMLYIPYHMYRGNPRRIAGIGADAIPYLIPIIQGADPYRKGTALAALSYMGPEAAPAVDILTAMLASPGDPLIPEIISALNAIGPAARPAVEQMCSAIAAWRLARLSDWYRTQSKEINTSDDVETRRKRNKQRFNTLQRTLSQEFENAIQMTSKLMLKDDIPLLTGWLEAKYSSAFYRIAVVALPRFGADAAESILNASMKQAISNWRPLKHEPLLLEIGKPAAPVLLKKLDDPSFKVLHIQLARTIWKIGPEVDVSYMPYYIHTIRAPKGKKESAFTYHALFELGAAAAKVVPALLTSYYKDPNWFQGGSQSAPHREKKSQYRKIILNMGKDAIPHLISAIDVETTISGEKASNTSTPLAMALLGEFGPEATVAVPVLTKYIRNNSSNNILAIDALTRIGVPASDELEGLLLRELKKSQRISPGSWHKMWLELSVSKRRPSMAIIARAIARLAPTKEAIPLLLNALTKSSNDETRIAAGEALGTIGSVAIPELIKLLDHDDGAIRRAAIIGLGKAGQDAIVAIPRLVEFLDAKLPENQIATAQALGRMGPGAKDTIPALLRFHFKYRHEDYIHRGPYIWFGNVKRQHRFKGRGLTAGEALAMIGEPAYQYIHQAIKKGGVNEYSAIASLRFFGVRAVPDLIAFASDRKMSDSSRHSAIETLAAFGPDAKAAVPALIAFTRDSDIFIRYRFHAVETLAAIGPAAEAAVPVLISIMGDEISDHQRRIAIRSIAAIGPKAKAAVPSLIVIAGDSQIPWWVRNNAIEALGAIGPDAKAAVPTLKKIDAEITGTYSNSQLSLSSIRRALEKIQPDPKTKAGSGDDTAAGDKRGTN